MTLQTIEELAMKTWTQLAIIVKYLLKEMNVNEEAWFKHWQTYACSQDIIYLQTEVERACYEDMNTTTYKVSTNREYNSLLLLNLR